MIAVNARGLTSLQREFKSAPKLYRQAMLRTLSTTKRDTKADATKIAQTIYTAGRNKISAALSTSNIDKSKLSFKLIGLKRGISLVDFEHQASVGKKARGKPVLVKTLRTGGFATIPDTIKKRGSITGKMRLIQFQRSGSRAAIALASSSVADMLNRPAVADRLNAFSTNKMSNELARQISVVFR